MAATPGGKPRISAIPTPGRSSIPTPGRLRASSSASSTYPPLPTDNATLEHAFASAIKNNNPARYNASPNLSPSSSGSFRPPSVASSTRPKTPSANLNKSNYRRPESRQSDVFSRTQRSFESGDSVRVESLGFEGTLRYVGEIRGKQGLWAGVELSGGFAGKGKNDGSVDGVRYFQCPPKCGVFVATTKLSPPAVRPAPAPRPSSVASSRASISGRTTPSIPGRATPSFSNGRLTPVSSGRLTPSSNYGFSTPAARPRASLARSTAVPAAITPSATAMSKITAGSRASKYIGMTAKQLSSRDTHSLVPGSPSRQSSIASPSRSIPDSPLGPTPKPASRVSGIGAPKGFGIGRPSLATPKARIPSSVAMPPPPSPSIGKGSRSTSANEKLSPSALSTAGSDFALDDRPDSLSNIRQNGRALQDKIQLMMSGKITPSLGMDSPHTDLLHFQGDDVAAAPQNAGLDALQLRINALERENELLKADESKKANEAVASMETARLEKDRAMNRLAELESQVKTTERTVKERDTRIESLERAAQMSSESIERLRTENEARVKHQQAQLDDSEKLMTSLKEALEVQANAVGQNEGLLQAKNAEISLLEGRVQKAYAEFEETKSELTAQVDELREAGQETIALYEERLSAAEAKRYELEDAIEALEEQLKNLGRPSSPTSIMRHASEAAKIENETLREQVIHLQKKITNLEELLEDARVTYEKDEVAFRARITRYKENEGVMKKELTDAKKETDRVLKAEASAKHRIEEMDEALQENTLALENARAEVEGLRLELANAESQLDQDSNLERADGQDYLVTAELTRLKSQLEDVRTAKRKLAEQLESSQQDMADTTNSLISLRQMVETLDSEKAEFEHINHEQEKRLDRERTIAIELRKALEDKTTELETSRKSFNRDRPLSAASGDSSSSMPSKPEREEIKGLKHIIQELQKENATLVHQSKLLESENKVLLSETDQLRDELKSLEESVEASLLQQEKALDAQENLLSSSDSQSMQNTFKEMKVKHELEAEQLRKKFAELEMKNNRTIHDLNKEVAELESLVEVKIYREDELEREIERLKDKVSRAKKSSKSSMEAPPIDQRSIASSRNSVSSIAVSSSADLPSGELCEICEKPGHDIFSCPVLKDDALTSAPGPSASTRASIATDLWCEDCESHGHMASECPHALDVF